MERNKSTTGGKKSNTTACAKDEKGQASIGRSCVEQEKAEEETKGKPLILTIQRGNARKKATGSQ